MLINELLLKTIFESIRNVVAAATSLTKILLQNGNEKIINFIRMHICQFWMKMVILTEMNRAINQCKTNYS